MIEHECKFGNTTVTSLQDETTSRLRFVRDDDDVVEFSYDRDILLRAFNLVDDSPDFIFILIATDSDWKIELGRGETTLFVRVGITFMLTLKKHGCQYFRELLTAYELSLEE